MNAEYERGYGYYPDPETVPGYGYLPHSATIKGYTVGPVQDVVESLTTMSPRVLQMFPSGFLMFCFGIFSVPMALVVHLSFDPTVQMFMPQFSWTVYVLIPVLCVLTFFVHLLREGRPSRFFITATLIVSCVLLLILSDTWLLQAYQKAPAFASSDCMSWPEKRLMQTEWESARGFYATCMSEKSKKEGISFAGAIHAYRIQDCADYSTELRNHPQWAYLGHLEDTQNCAGWCEPGQPMWTRGETKDACSPVVAEILTDKVAWCMRQVCFYALITLMVMSVILITIRPLLEKYGIEW
jgi:hypothetical protein